MTTVTLDQLKAFEARLLTALSDPTRAVFYDDFKRENRPVAELDQALTRVRAEIARLTPADPAAAIPARRYLSRHRSAL